jgi:D-alanyl-D-alanine carboxypeptidase
MHTSGLPDYFEGKNKKERSLYDEIINSQDQSWTFEQAIKRSKALKPHFAPGAKGKAHYSDTNFQLLGKVIEIATGKSFADNCRDLIIRPLGMTKTYLYQDANDTTPQPLYFRANVAHVPKAMASFGPDGGMVSTAGDMLVFIEAFLTDTFSRTTIY